MDWLEDVARSRDPNAYVFFETDIGEGDHGIYKTFAIQHNVRSDEGRLRSLDFVAAEIEDLGVDVRIWTEMIQLAQDESDRVTGVYAEAPTG